jgi:hypothetical protein
MGKLWQIDNKLRKDLEELVYRNRKKKSIMNDCWLYVLIQNGYHAHTDK